MLRFFDCDDHLEVDLIERERGDAWVAVSVRSSGFAAAIGECWIDGPEFRGFCRALIELERTRNGRVALSAMSPGELELAIVPMSSLGAFAVTGSLSKRSPRPELCHALKFGFAFDPSQLIAAAAVPWVKETAR